MYMMRTNHEIRTNAKARTSLNYWPGVLASLLVALALGVLEGVGSLPALIGGFTSALGVARGGPEEVLQVIAASTAASSTVISVLILALIGPISIGLNYFFIQSVQRKMETSEVALPFSEGFHGYLRKLGGYLWATLFTFLWSLLFVIPGIIKAFSYSQSAYILADCPNVKAKDALVLSIRMMRGHKGQLFLLCLSFIGWDLLNCLTFGLLGLFYVSPYKNNAFANFYLEVRETALMNGVITPGQLDGIEEV